MKRFQCGGRRLVGAVGAAAAGLGGAQSANAAVVFQPVDADVPPTYGVNFDNDSVVEFEISDFASVTKVGELAPTTAIVEDPTDDRTANLALGTLIGPSSPFSADGVVPAGGDPLNGTIDHDDDPETPNVPAGHFQPDDPPGFIGVKFDISGNTHFGWVGYEGVGNPADPTGHVFGLGYDDAPDTAILAGAGIPAGLPGDYNDNGTVDAADYTVWHDNLGGPGSALTNRDPDNMGAISGDDYDSWVANFGMTTNSGIAALGASQIPEPTSLCLLAAGGVGLGLYRRRSRSDVA